MLDQIMQKRDDNTIIFNTQEPAMQPQGPHQPYPPNYMPAAAPENTVSVDWSKGIDPRSTIEALAKAAMQNLGLEHLSVVKTPAFLVNDNVAPVTTPTSEEVTQALRPGKIVNEKGAVQSFIAADFSCIPPECLNLLAECLGRGARIYGKENWKDISMEDNLSHAMNHINLWRMNDRTEPHLVNAMARITFALWLAINAGEQPVRYIHPEDHA